MYLRRSDGSATGSAGSAVPSQHVLTLMGSVQRPGGNRIHLGRGVLNSC